MIDEAIERTHQRPHAGHLLFNRTVITAAFGIKLDAHSVRGDFVQKGLNLVRVLLCVRLDGHLAKAQASPLVFQGAPPIGNPAAEWYWPPC